MYSDLSNMPTRKSRIGPPRITPISLRSNVEAEPMATDAEDWRTILHDVETRTLRTRGLSLGVQQSYQTSGPCSVRVRTGQGSGGRTLQLLHHGG